MSTIRFEFSRRGSETPGGFDLGDVVVLGDGQVATSRGHSPSKTMMIYLAIVDLVLGVSRLCLMEQSANYVFVGADSSFRLEFQVSNRGYISLVGTSGVVSTTDRWTFLDGMRKSLDLFLSAGNELPVADPVAEDLAAARKELHAALCKVHRG
jgi:hypothetical protein